jgi:alpha-1,3/alpha-1,6-mannosyltransferase
LSGELANLHPEVFFLDQLSANILLLRWWWKDTRILFYCHFPDLLLVQGRRKWWKRVWRVGFDWLEGIGMKGADRIVVNSRFTKSVVEQVWKGLGRGRGVGIVYPCVDTGNNENQLVGDDKGKQIWKEKKVVLSVNRFERKKNIELAIKAYAGLTVNDREKSRLVIAGLSCPQRSM